MTAGTWMTRISNSRETKACPYNLKPKKKAESIAKRRSAYPQSLFADVSNAYRFERIVISALVFQNQLQRYVLTCPVWEGPPDADWKRARLKLLRRAMSIGDMLPGSMSIRTGAPSAI